MKKKICKIISFILALSFIFSSFCLYGSAQEESEYTDSSAEQTAEKVTEESTDKKVIHSLGTNLSRDDAIKSAITMKLYSNYCYHNGARKALRGTIDNAYGAPLKIDGVVYVPLFAILSTLKIKYSIYSDSRTTEITSNSVTTVITVGSGNAVVGGENVTLKHSSILYTDEGKHNIAMIAIDDVQTLLSGYYVTYDDMGLIIIGTQTDIVNRDKDLEFMIDLVEKFVFDYTGMTNVYNIIEENTNQDHPYLLIDSDKFQTMREDYRDYSKAGSTPLNSLEKPIDYYQMIEKYVNQGEKSYRSYAKPSSDDVAALYESYVGLLPDTEIESDTMYGGISLLQPNLIPEEQRTRYNANNEVTHFFEFDSNGYEMAGGRIEISNRTVLLMQMAFAYQITGDLDYVRCAYDAAVRLGEWVTWGTGHFLSLGGARDFALFYDWAYDGIKELEKDGVICEVTGEVYNTETIAQILYDKAVSESYRFEICRQGKMAYRSYDKPVKKGYNGVQYHTSANNWNATCSNGIITACLAILDSGVGEINPTPNSEVEKVIGSRFVFPAINTTVMTPKQLIEYTFKYDMYFLIAYGIWEYAPDGSYYEGPGYWGATNNLYSTCMMLDTACGTNFGLMEGIGIYETCFYAMYVEDNNNQFFPYNDTGNGSMDTYSFFYVGQYFDDDLLISVRKNQLSSGLKKSALADLVWYPTESVEDNEMGNLDYYSDRIDMFTTRASWENGALFAGMIGGQNKMTHGQIDAGTFVYYNGGTKWFMDLGSDNYNNLGDYWSDNTRYRYYRMKPEGHNTVAITSETELLPFGQDLNGYADAYQVGTNIDENGSYVKFSMQKTTNGVTKYWNRGMLLTNSRKTTVIQDEMEFSKPTNAYWFAHFDRTDMFRFNLSSDGKTATFLSKKYQTLRVSIVSEDPNLKFEIWDTYTFVHAQTEDNGIHPLNYNPDYYTYYKDQFAPTGSALGENNRENYRKLVIRAEECLEFKVAVVIEMIDPENEVSLGYEWTPMTSADWAPKADDRVYNDPEEDDPIAPPVIEGENRLSYPIGKFAMSAEALKDIMENKNTEMFTSEFENLYRILTDMQYLYDNNTKFLNNSQADKMEMFNDGLEAYEIYREDVGAVFDITEAVFKACCLDF